jgi:hypothetical protein
MFLNKFLKKPTPSIHPPAGLITDITDLDEFKQRLGIKSRAKILSDLIKYLDPLPEQSRKQNLPLHRMSGKIVLLISGKTHVLNYFRSLNISDIKGDLPGLRLAL